MFYSINKNLVEFTNKIENENIKNICLQQKNQNKKIKKQSFFTL